MSSNPLASVQYLKSAASLPGVKAIKARSYEMMRIQPGDRVLDVGCGPGIDTAALAEKVGPSGKVDGIDTDPQMIRHADLAAAEAGISDRVVHRGGSCVSLPYADGSFAASRAERLLQHLSQTEAGQMLREIVRVTAAGGWVVLVDTDWGTLSTDAEAGEVERKIAWIYRRQLKNPFAGRSLLRMMKEAGLEDVEIEPLVLRLEPSSLERIRNVAETVGIPEGLITKGEIEKWDEGMKRSLARGDFYAHLVMVAASGRCPGK